VSLRDVQRLLVVAGWFYSHRNLIFPAIDGLAHESSYELNSDDEEEQTPTINPNVNALKCTLPVLYYSLLKVLPILQFSLKSCGAVLR